MARGRKKSEKKITKPIFYIFCEGESEKKYISFLKSLFRTKRIFIFYKKLGSKINQKLINTELKNNVFLPEKDKIFLLYDGDVISVLERLKRLKKTILLISNPSIELWYILHFQEQNSFINQDNCLKKLKKIWKNYKKGELKDEEKNDLYNFEKAMENSKKLKKYKNPSSSIFLLIEELKKLKKNKIY